MRAALADFPRSVDCFCILSADLCRALSGNIPRLTPDAFLRGQKAGGNRSIFKFLESAPRRVLSNSLPRNNY
jgi:hypothetical protein